MGLECHRHSLRQGYNNENRENRRGEPVSKLGTADGYVTIQ
jgi:hypothetical protein